MPRVLTPKLVGSVVVRPLRPSADLQFQSTIPTPLRLTPGRANQFTISGTGLDSVKSVVMVMTRTPWRLPGRIISSSKSAITVAVDVPKYLALGPYVIQAVKVDGSLIDTGLTAEADEFKPCAVWTEFNPWQHGFCFVNTTWSDVCFTTVGFRLEYKSDGPFCGSDWGLCGGMSLNAGERFRDGLTDTHDMNQGDAKHAVVDAQFRTLDGPTVKKFLDWIYSPNKGRRLDPMPSVGQRMMNDWNSHIKPELDAYRPVVLGLIFDQISGLGYLDPRNVMKITEQHQVLGIGYTRIGQSTVRICAYDPNYPHDILVLTFDTPNAGVKQELDSGNSLHPDRKSVRGVMFVRSVP